MSQYISQRLESLNFRGDDQIALADICSGRGWCFVLFIFGFLLGSKWHIALITINQCHARGHIDHRHSELKHSRPQPGGAWHAHSRSANIYSLTCLCRLSPVAPSNGARLATQSAAPRQKQRRWHGAKPAHHYGERQAELECSEVLIESA